MGAVLGLNYGWEHPLYSEIQWATDQTDGFTRQTWWDRWARNARCCATCGHHRYLELCQIPCKGAGAEDWLNAVFANTMPKAVGRSCLTPLIGKRGGIAGDFTVTRLAEDEFWIIGSGMAERYHQRFFNEVPLPEGTTFESRTNDMCGFNVAGPKSRDMLQRMTNTSLATPDFPFMRSKWIELGGVRCLALRVSFTGDLGWELHCDAEDQARCLQALIAAGTMSAQALWAAAH